MLKAKIKEFIQIVSELGEITPGNVTFGTMTTHIHTQGERDGEKEAGRERKERGGWSEGRREHEHVRSSWGWGGGSRKDHNFHKTYFEARNNQLCWKMMDLREGFEGP